MPTRTYKGPLAAGHIPLPTRRLSFTAGEPVEVSEDEAALLDDDWSEPKQPRKPKGPAPVEPQGDEPDTKEP